MVTDVLRFAEVTPDRDLASMQPGQLLEDLLARIMPALGQVMVELRPDWVVVQGDTLSALAGALAAHFQGLRIAHVEAGLRSGDLRAPAPEEAIRKMIAALADCHFAPTPAAVAALRAENIAAETIYLTGNTGIDALLAARASLAAAPHHAAVLDQIVRPFAGKRLIAVTVHRRENQGSALDQIAAALRQLAQRSDCALIYPLHPNPHIRQAMQAKLAGCANVALIDPLDYPNFVALLDRAALILTDSGGVQEEAPALGKPVLVLRDRTERPEGVMEGTALLVGSHPDCIVQAATHLLEDAKAYAQMARAHNPYGSGTAAQQIAKVLVYGG